MKILVSPGFGAGWSTWAGHEAVVKFALTYQPIIDYIEAGNRFTDKDCHDYVQEHPLLTQFLVDLQAATGEDYFYFGGASRLEVEDVGDDEFRVNEYDGNESVEYRVDDSGWYSEHDFR